MNNFNIDIRQSKKWDSFFNWWHSNYRDLEVSDYDDLTIDLTYWAWFAFPFEFQVGVYIKYIEEELKYRYSLVYLHDDKKHLISIPDTRISTKYWHSTPFNTLQELILYTFNN